MPKCKFCGKHLLKRKNDPFIKDGSYFCDEFEFVNYNVKKEQRLHCYNLICEIMGYDFVPPVMQKKLKELEEFGYDVLTEAITLSMEGLKFALTKEYKNESCRVAYCIAIIKNNYYSAKKNIKKQKDEQLQETIMEFDCIDERNNTLPLRDISAFLDE